MSGIFRRNDKSEYVKGSGKLTEDTQIVTGRGGLYMLRVYTDGSNAATAELYDGTDNTGKLLLRAKVSGADLNAAPPMLEPLGFNTGLYLDITGTGAFAIVDYDDD